MLHRGRCSAKEDHVQPRCEVCAIPYTLYNEVFGMRLFFSCLALGCVLIAWLVQPVAILSYWQLGFYWEASDCLFVVGSVQMWEAVKSNAFSVCAVFLHLFCGRAATMTCQIHGALELSS